ncbi:MAG: hypothetical protein HY812_21840 [Planctomycetes bacterium]|nr:hypothetical protein [Planctomycetota bacterium]
MKKPALTPILLLLLSTPLLAETVAFDRNWGPQGISVLEDTDGGLVLNYSTRCVSFVPVVINHENMTAISMPGAPLIGNDEDAPNLPGMGRLFAVPRGATFRLEILDARAHVFRGVSIAPAPRIPDDNSHGPLVYVKDPVIYSSNAYYPASPVMLSDPTLIRGVDAGLVGITPFQYNPVTKELLVYSDVRIRISFSGGNPVFGEDRLRSRLFDPILRQHFINSSRLSPLTSVGSLARAAGEAEYVIIVPDVPDFIKWGEVLRDFRYRQGVVSEVYTLAQVGSDANAIRSWIHNAVKTWSMPPAAVLLLADAPGPAASSIPVPMWGGYTPSDNVYADVYGNDDLPDIVISRLTARNKTELEEMVMKVIDYETDPPAAAAFYDKPTLAMGWESDRWFGLCAEIVYGYFSNVLGKTPNREYQISWGSVGSTWSTATNTNLVVDYFGPNGLGYIPLTPAHLTDWSGNAAKINADLNAGSFLALHRDHGSPSGWASPSYTISDLAGLTNDMLPYVLSINCSSGAFAGSSECFAEAMTRMHHGAVGVTAASATSYSFVNDTYVWGMIDAMWPGFDPGYANSAEEILQPCFANASGKFYLKVSNWPYNSSSKSITYHLFHAHCCPLFTMCSEVPQALSVTHPSTLPLGSSSLQITATAGADVCLTVDSGGSIGILGAVVADGSPQTISFAPQTEPRLLTVTVTKPNHVRYSAQVWIPAMASFQQYGQGLAGSGGYVPELLGEGYPICGCDITVRVDQGLGAANGLLCLGPNSAALPGLGGTVLVQPLAWAIPIKLSGKLGLPMPGTGSFSFTTLMTLSGVTLYMQAFLADPGAPFGVSMTNGLEMVAP